MRRTSTRDALNRARTGFMSRRQASNLARRTSMGGAGG